MDAIPFTLRSHPPNVAFLVLARLGGCNRVGILVRLPAVRWVVN